MRFGTAIAVLLLSTSTAVSAPFDWKGFYVGINGGFATGNTDVERSNDEADHALSGGVFGVQLGYNMVMDGGWVLGAEGTIAWAGITGEALVDTPPGNNQYEGSRYRWVATIAPKLGYLATEQLLIYGKAGLALANLDGYFRDNTNNLASNQTQIGAIVGVGGEYAVTDTVTVGAEYNLNLYAQAPRTNGTLFSYAAQTTTHALLFKLNFHM